jgi:hypothetical protein
VVDLGKTLSRGLLRGGSMKFLVEQAFGRDFGVGLRGSAMVEKSLEQARQRFALPSYSGNDCCTSRIRAWPRVSRGVDRRIGERKN